MINTSTINEFKDLDALIINAIEPQTTFKKNNEWYDAQCEFLRKESFVYLNLFRKYKSVTFKDKYLFLASKFKEICKIKKENFRNNQILKLNTVKNSKEFWKLAKAINGQQTLLSINAELEDLVDHFSNITKSDPFSKFHMSFATPLIYDAFLDAPFSESDLNEVLSSCKDGKAAGLNRIPSEFYKYACFDFHTALLSLCNKIYNDGYIGTDYLTSVIFDKSSEI